MKKLVSIMPLVAVVLVVVGLLLSQGQHQLNPNATMLQTEETITMDSYESILEEATFYVKARFIEETTYLEGTSYQYTYELLEDYSGNLRPQDGTRFFVYSMMTGLYEPGEIYYLFLQGTESYMADTIMYTFVEDTFVARYEDGLLVDSVCANIDAPSAIDAFENQVRNYAVNETTAEKTADTFASDAYLTLEDNVASADAIWLVTILDKQDMNPNSSLCEYRLEQVFRGNTETAPEGSVFNGMFPRTQVEETCSYYVILKDVGNYEYRPFTFDHWLIPEGSEESTALLELLGEETTAASVMSD